MPVEIKIYHDTARDTLTELLELAGGLRPVDDATKVAAAKALYDDAVTGTGVVETKADGSVERVAPVEYQKAEAPKRERGKPSPGRARRTKEEIAEDEAADAADAAAQAAAVEANIQADDKAQISTGENRVGPEDDPETEAQDAADEAAETAANGGLAPIDELRRAVGDYQKKFGMPAAVALVQEGGLIGRAVIDVPEAEIPAVVAKVRAALDGAAPTASKTEAVQPKQEEKPATKEDLQRAMLRYADRFDGQSSDMSKMPATMEDMPKIFALLFGEGVTKLSQVPADGYARAIAGIDEAIQKDPFGRSK